VIQCTDDVPAREIVSTPRAFAAHTAAVDSTRDKDAGKRVRRVETARCVEQ
jgi:hypothetical protein